tara:strand:- start:74 stop:247 length:174 start_codon:yes stop_codon:yes gene_type:complete
MVTSNGRSLIASTGKTIVVRAAEKFEAANQASAVVSKGKLILKGKSHLWCIGTQKVR